MTRSNFAVKLDLPACPEVGDYVEVFEVARRQDEQTDLSDFLPAADDPHYLEVLVELIRADLDYGWRSGRPQSLTAYADRFPEWFADVHHRGQVAFEEYRLRCRAGEQPSVEEYRQRFKVDVAGWPVYKEPEPVKLSNHIPRPRSTTGLGVAAQAFKQFLSQSQATGEPNLDSWCDSWQGSAEHAHLFRELHQSNPEAAQRLSCALTAMPEVGTKFLGFHLIAELGHGAFGKVFLARQGELAHRPVALKVATDLLGESQTLAQLQHTHIVPIYSVHHAAPFHAVCMPFCGRTTLADVLHDVTVDRGLPASGKSLVSTLRNHQARTTPEGNASRPPSKRGTDPDLKVAPPGDGSAAEQGSVPATAEATLLKLEGMTYVEAILWLAVRLADGLAHAHDRGILHGDLKPANVLVSDEGQPMLLDFNLSKDSKLLDTPSAASVGGTLPYMAPEHLDALNSGEQSIDVRSDLYSFGVILYELLTGSSPFTQHRGLMSAEVLARMLAERRLPPPLLRHLNSAVSPAVESIVRHCLQPEPGQRYQTAHDLREDLQRHLDNKPLRHAPEPSLFERSKKWMRRHPRLASRTTVAAVLLTLLLTLTVVFGYQGHRARRLAEAQSAYRDTQDDMQTARFLLNTHSADQQKRQQGLRACRQIIDRYQLRDNAAWKTLPVVQYLSAEQQQRLQEDLGETLWLAARTTLAETADHPHQADNSQRLQDALEMNRLAETCYLPGQAPAILWRQRAELARKLGQQDEAERSEATAKTRTPVTARDHYHLAAELVVEGRLQQALPSLREATRLDPQHFWAWFMKGVCHDQLSQSPDAKASYTACIALWPSYPWSYFNRGLVHLRDNHYVQACADFNEAIRLHPDSFEMYLNRALALHGQGNHRAAIDDLTQALKLGASPCRVLFLRSRLHALAGASDTAKQDHQDGMNQQPSDENDWIARGLARLPANPDGALRDFGQALQINPRSLAALQNQVHVLADSPGRINEAIRILNRVVELYPDYVPARSGRGVLLARNGQRKAALADAEDSLRRDTSPRILYQVAGIYALTSQQQPEDRHEAFRLLSSALRQGFGFDLLAGDRDLDSLRDHPQFQRLIDTAQTLR